MTTSLEVRCLESFPGWLRELASDARVLSAILISESSEGTRRSAALALTYLVKSFDWIDPELEALGLFEDACVVRVLSTRLPAAEWPPEAAEMLDRFTTELPLLLEFLGPEGTSYLDRHVRAIEERYAIDAVRQDPEEAAVLAESVQRWAQGYAPPTLLRDSKELLKLKAFLSSRLAASVPDNEGRVPE